jgi:hypothetical protein
MSSNASVIVDTNLGVAANTLIDIVKINKIVNNIINFK